MTSNTQRRSVVAIIKGLGWPLLIGGAACVAFYLLVFKGPLNLPLLHRYFAAHPVSFFATGMFFVGLVALGIKLLDTAGQYLSLNEIKLEEPPADGHKVDDAERLLDWIEEQPARLRNSYFGQRIRNAFDFVARSGSAAGLDDELKYLSDMDAQRQHDSYALVRIIIWATPMLGFLGTVIGITQALGDLSQQQLAGDLQNAMEGLLSGLYVAFDTTALALCLSIVLMFVKFFIERVETQLLSVVDEMATDELMGRFEVLGSQLDPHLLSIQRMNQSVIRATEQLVQRQTELWQATMDTAFTQWTQQMKGVGSVLQNALGEALQEGLQRHSDCLEASLTAHSEALVEAEKTAASNAQQRYEQWQRVVAEHSQAMKQQQERAARQAEVLASAVTAIGEIKGMESALNDNLQALSGAHHFEETVMSLSAAINLLNIKLGGDSQRVHFKPDAA